jgi:hypothetical protein
MNRRVFLAVLPTACAAADAATAQSKPPSLAALPEWLERYRLELNAIREGKVVDAGSQTQPVGLSIREAITAQRDRFTDLCVKLKALEGWPVGDGAFRVDTKTYSQRHVSDSITAFFSGIHTVTVWFNYGVLPPYKPPFRYAPHDDMMFWPWNRAADPCMDIFDERRLAHFLLGNLKGVTLSKCVNRTHYVMRYSEAVNKWPRC